MLILSVDDDQTTTALLAAILGGGGHTVLRAHSAEEALEALKGASIDLLITDYCLPDMEGAELLKAVRAMPAYAELPIILCSGSDFSKEVSGLGHITRMFKPFNIPKLLEYVHAAAQNAT